MAVNYEDERFTQVESDKQQALTEMEKTYGKQNADGTYTGGMIGSVDKYYQDQINASKDWADKQSQLQQEQTDLAVEQIEQQKEQAQKDYIKEQSGAYVDWRKQSNQYGTEAEKMAAQGLANTGYSESSQVSMYNTYQNRVATARESYNLAVQNYNIAIKDAQMQNNAALAEITYQALQQQLELSLQGFQYKNQLILDRANMKTEIDNTYYNRYLDVLNQINTENAMAEEIRQYNESLALQKAQLAESQRQFNVSNPTIEDGLVINKDGGGGTGSAGNVGAGVAVAGQKAALAVTTSNIYKKTEYFDGYLPKATANDIKTYGAFSNGYQPKGISGHGTLKKTGGTYTMYTTTLSGEKKTVKQNAWKASDGTLWYWDGRDMKYHRYF